MPKAAYLRLINFRTPQNYLDLHPVYRDVEPMGALIEDLSREVAAFEPDIICGIQSQGFILGAAVAVGLKKPFVQIQKWSTNPVLPSFTLATKDYTTKWKNFAIRKGSFESGARCAVIDDWIDTGRQVQCAMDLIAQMGGKVVCVAVIHADSNAVSRRLNGEKMLIAMDAL